VLSRQKLNVQPYKERPRKFLSYHVQVGVYAQFFALRTSRRYLTSRQTFCTKGCSVLALAVSYSVLQVAQVYRFWWKVKLILHKSHLRRIREVSVLVVAGDRKRKPSAEPSLRQFSYSRMLSRRCGCVVAFCHVEKHVVYFQIAGMLTTTLNVALDNSVSWRCPSPLLHPEEEMSVPSITQHERSLSSSMHNAF
jgi:hypothetical protein